MSGGETLQLESLIEFGKNQIGKLDGWDVSRVEFSGTTGSKIVRTFVEGEQQIVRVTTEPELFFKANNGSEYPQIFSMDINGDISYIGHFSVSPTEAVEHLPHGSVYAYSHENDNGGIHYFEQSVDGSIIIHSAEFMDGEFRIHTSVSENIS